MPSAAASGPDAAAQSGEALVARSTPPTPPRTRRGLVAVLAAIAFVCTGLVFAAVWPVPPPAPPARVPEPVAHVAKPVPEVTPAPSPALPAEVPAQTQPAIPPSAPEPLPPPTASPPPRAQRTGARSQPARADRPERLLEPPAPAPALAPAPAPALAPAPAAPAPRAPAAAAPAGPTADELNKQAGQELLQGHLARAAELFGQATARDPRNAAAWRGLGLTSERLDRTREAVRAYRRSLQLAPTGPQADSVRARLEQLK